VLVEPKALPAQFGRNTAAQRVEQTKGERPGGPKLGHVLVRGEHPVLPGRRQNIRVGDLKAQISGSDGMNPSAMRAALRAAGSLLPPMLICGPPFWKGAGVMWTVRPRYSKGSPVRACLRVVTTSVTRATRSFIPTPNISNSSCT
jgi:hypothetical protein